MKMFGVFISFILLSLSRSRETFGGSAYNPAQNVYIGEVGSYNSEDATLENNLRPARQVQMSHFNRRPQPPPHVFPRTFGQSTGFASRSFGRRMAIDGNRDNQRNRFDLPEFDYKLLENPARVVTKYSPSPPKLSRPQPPPLVDLPDETLFHSIVVNPPGIIGPAPPPGPTPSEEIIGGNSLITTPAPPTGGIIIGPPSPPILTSTPAPHTNSGSQVTQIKCLEIDNQETFSALLSLPDGYEAVPQFEDRPIIDPTTHPVCRMIPTQLVGMFQLIVSSHSVCGVRKCEQSNGETWNCLVLRFPRLNGLKLPEDEIVEIRCRPQDQTENKIHVVSVATAKHSMNPPMVYEGLQGLRCAIGLFRQVAGTQAFRSPVTEDAPLELGERVQLMSVVKNGDGWEYSRLSEVIIQKDDGNRERSAINTAVLVYSDGCRNPNYKVIAEDHPIRDSANSLLTKFTFRVFMFQDMMPGDSLLISAKVVGCIHQVDCQPNVCPDDGGQGYGRRRRAADEYKVTTKFVVPPSDSEKTTPISIQTPGNNIDDRKPSNKTTNWSRNLAIKVRMPNEYVKQRSISFGDCKIYLYISLAVALIFCIFAITFISFTLFRNKATKLNSKEVALSVAPKSPENLNKLHKKKRLQLQNSSSSSDIISYSSETYFPETNIPSVCPPPSDKQRKHQFHKELLGIFSEKTLAEHYPQLLNNHGYMLMPRPNPETPSKPSICAVKRHGRTKSLPHFTDENGTDYTSSNSRSSTSFQLLDEDNVFGKFHCKEDETTSTILNNSEGSQDNYASHISVIRISSSDSLDTLTKCSTG